MSSPKVFISHASALEFWRHHDLDPSGGIKRSRIRSVRDGVATGAAIRALVKNAMPTTGRVFGARPDTSLPSSLTDLHLEQTPLHVMVGKSKNLRRWDNLRAHLFEKPLPEGSFCEIGPGVYVASPELTLCQMSLEEPFVDTLELCLEFCSGYVLNPESERGFDDRPALTSRRRLASYVDKLSGRRGAKPLKRILPYVIDNSASPMESIVLMLLCLPTRLGGYQLPLPEHNVVIPVNERARSHTNREKLCCDLYWAKKHLDVECDSTSYHSSKHQLGIDSDRRIILDAMGHPYVGITRWQLEDAGRFLDVVQAIRRALGLQLRKEPEHVKINREALRAYLVEPKENRRPLIYVSARS